MLEGRRGQAEALGRAREAAYHLYRRGDLDLAPFIRLERFEIRPEEDPANGLLSDFKSYNRQEQEPAECRPGIHVLAKRFAAAKLPPEEEDP